MDPHRAQQGTTISAHTSDPSRFKLRTKKNDQQMIAFIIAVVSLAAVFIIFPAIRRLGASSRPNVFTRLSRRIRKVLLLPMMFLPSVGHGLLATLYTVINVSIAFTNTDNSLTPLSRLGARMAWMAIANMVVVVILALKNTPLALISPWSYERLNILHQVAGTISVIFVILHGCMYTVNFTYLGMADRLLEPKEIFGMVAGLSFLILGVAGMVIRRWWYELFYYIHVTLWVLGLVMTALHQPQAATKVLYVIPVAAGIWSLDRAIRLGRLLAYSSGNYVTLTPLPHGATRVTLEKAPVGARAGKHCYLWIPRIRPTEAHPFTMVSADPVEFVVMSYDGFTSSLHKFALANPGGRLRASVDGPYGSNPDPARFDKTVLVAGGSGATFTMGVALDMLSRSTETKEIVFIWMVKEKAYLTWFAEKLNQLQHDRRFKMLLYVTRETAVQQQQHQQQQEVPAPPSPGSSSPDEEKSLSFPMGDPEKDAGRRRPQPPWRRQTASSSSGKEESNSEDDLASPVDGIESEVHNLPVNYERPKVAELVGSAIAGSSPDEKVLVMVCGPKQLSEPVRRTTANMISSDGPSIELHCEQFGW